MTDQERFVVTAITGTLMFTEKKYPAFFDFVFKKTGYKVESLEDLADQDIWAALYAKNISAFEKLIKD